MEDVACLAFMHRGAMRDSFRQHEAGLTPGISVCLDNYPKRRKHQGYTLEDWGATSILLQTEHVVDAVYSFYHRTQAVKLLTAYARKPFIGRKKYHVLHRRK